METFRSFSAFIFRSNWSKSSQKETFLSLLIPLFLFWFHFQTPIKFIARESLLVMNSQSADGANNNQAAHDGANNENKHSISDCTEYWCWMKMKTRKAKNGAQIENQSIRKYLQVMVLAAAASWRSAMVVNGYVLVSSLCLFSGSPGRGIENRQCSCHQLILV